MVDLMKDRFTTLTQKTALVFLGVFIALLCVEILLRISGSVYLIYRKGLDTGAEKAPGSYTILCLGDSFTLGFGAEKGGDYPSQLAKMLRENNPERRFEVINKGIEGQNSSELLYSLNDNLNKHDPDMVIVMTGMNDGHNTHLHNWASGQRGWRARSYAWLTGLRIYKLLNLTRVSIRDSGGSRQAGPQADVDNTSHRETELAVSKAKALFQDGRNQEALDLLVGASNKENMWQFITIAKEYDADETGERIIKKVLETDTNDAGLLFILGKIYAAHNKPEEAERVLRSVIATGPEHDYARFDLAGLYMSQKRYRDAEALLLETRKVQGASLRANRLLIACYEAQGNKEAADRLRKNISFYEEITGHNMSEIKRIVSQKGIKLIVMNYPRNDYLPAAAAQDVIFVDNKAAFEAISYEAREKMFSADNHHCNAQGYQVIAQNALNAVEGIMRQE